MTKGFFETLASKRDGGSGGVAAAAAAVADMHLDEAELDQAGWGDDDLDLAGAADGEEDEAAAAGGGWHGLAEQRQR